MGARSSVGDGKGGTIERPESGNYPARCIQVVELGTHHESVTVQGQGTKEKDLFKLLIVWELAETMSDGRPFVVHKEYTNSLGEKANLRKDLVSWRGKDFTPEELKDFELKNILDKCCLLNVQMKKSAAGNEYSKVIAVTPLPKGFSCPERHNDLVDFGIGDLDSDEYDKLWGWVQKKVLDSFEGKASGKVWEEKQRPEEPKAEPEFPKGNPEDEVPF